MPATASPLSRSAVTTKLRAAGCVFADDEARLLLAAARTPAELADMVDRRTAGLPLEQVLGWAEFCGLRIFLDPGVFVPRRRTEFLVAQALDCLPPAGTAAARPRVVLDLCCGSGAVGAAMVSAAPGLDLSSVDIDPVAVTCARRNLEAVGGRVYAGDLYEPLPVPLRGRVDLIVANAPYVPTGSIGMMPPEARIHESPVALDGGADGLDVQRRVCAGARPWLAPKGQLLIETSERQALATCKVMAGNGLVARVTHSDDLDATVVIGIVQ